MRPASFLFPILGLAASTRAAACSKSVAISLDSSTDGGSSSLSAGISAFANDIAVDSIKMRAESKRQSGLDCTPAESCLSAGDLVFCFDESTYLIRIEDGSIANIITGDYTLSDGRTGNLYTGSTSPDSEDGAVSSTGDAQLTQTTTPTTTRTSLSPLTTASPTANSSPVSGSSATTTSGLIASPTPSQNYSQKSDWSVGVIVAAIGALFF
ncbi:hypothetical protein PVAG01_00845 [Phlyctema vagabunda]|uniref:Uncharacterized protein n=1 Tax=Phlyctema vagabunda TaxID=108571 RepID=A0ABR4PVH7_9HELO